MESTTLIQYSIAALIIIYIIYALIVARIKYDEEEEEKNRIMEGLKLNDLAKPFKQIGDKAQEGINKTKEAFNKMGDVFSKLTEGFKKMGDFFNDIKNFGVKLGQKFKNLGDGLRHSFDGIGNTFTGLNDGIGQGFVDIAKLLRYSGIYAITYLECGVKFVSNIFTYCILFYLLDIAQAIWYAPFRASFYALYVFGINLYGPVNLIWEWIVYIDDGIYRLIKASPLKYTSTVRFECYTCRRLKQSALKRIAGDVDNDFNNVIPDKVKRGVPNFRKAKDSFNDAVTW